MTTQAQQGIQPDSERDKNENVTDEKPLKPASVKECHGVTDETGGSNGNGESVHPFHFELTDGGGGTYRGESLESARTALTERYGDRLREVTAA